MVPQVKTDNIEAEGTVLNTFADFKCLVQLDNGANVTAYIGGKLRKNRIIIVPADRVKLELSPYEIGMGRIVWRLTR
jgi:translation initiation factor IF-1